MPKQTLVASEETKRYFSELPLPKDLNGNEVKGGTYWEIFTDVTKTFEDLATVTETYRRMQDLYDTINSGRFFLANAQRKHYPEFYSGEPPTWANDWVTSQFLNSAIHSYSAAFDIYLQILWISFELYKQYPDKAPSELSDANLDDILEVCNVNRIESQQLILGTQLIERIKNFHLSGNTKAVRNLCKQIKHRRSIIYSELSKDKHPIMIKSDSYDSHKTLSIYAIDDIIGKLKQFHKDLTGLSNYTIPIVPQIRNL